MTELSIPTNSALICAKALSAPVFSHNVRTNSIFSFDIDCPRLSGRVDTLPCLIHSADAATVPLDRPMLFCGQVRSSNRIIEGKSRLIVNLFVKSVLESAGEKTMNEVELTGYVCKEPIYRKTPFGREITDMLIAVNRMFRKSDYIPTIAWGVNARIASSLRVGQKIIIEGRLQSREYEKKTDEKNCVKRTAYEVSINQLIIMD